MMRSHAVAAAVTLLALLAPATAAVAADTPPANWQDPECEREGSPWATSEACTPPQGRPDEPAHRDVAPDCTGAVECNVAEDQLAREGRAQGLRSEGRALQARADAAAREYFEARPQGTGQPGQASTQSNVYYRFGWVSFYLRTASRRTVPAR